MMNYWQEYAKIAQKIDPACKLMRAWRLEGGVSADVTALEIELNDRTTKTVVVRQYGPVDLSRNPHVAQLEYRLLEILYSAGVPVPRPCVVDESGVIFSTPYIVIDLVDGSPDRDSTNAARQVKQLATVLGQIHTVEDVDISFLPDRANRIDYILGNPPDIFDKTMQEEQVREVLAAVWPLSNKNESVILHGDFWPGNVLWKDGQIAAVIDWEDAGRGDPLADVGNARLEILWTLGWEAMHVFTEHYLSHNVIRSDHLPYWDLVAALRTASKISTWGVSAETEARWIEQRHEFVQRALQTLTD